MIYCLTSGRCLFNFLARRTKRSKGSPEDWRTNSLNWAGSAGGVWPVYLFFLISSDPRLMFSYNIKLAGDCKTKSLQFLLPPDMICPAYWHSRWNMNSYCREDYLLEIYHIQCSEVKYLYIMYLLMLNPSLESLASIIFKWIIKCWLFRCIRIYLLKGPCCVSSARLWWSWAARCPESRASCWAQSAAGPYRCEIELSR